VTRLLLQEAHVRSLLAGVVTSDMRSPGKFAEV